MRLSHGESTTLAFLGGHIVFSFSSAFILVAGLTFAVLFFHEKNRITVENLKIKQEKQTLEHLLLVKNLEPHFLLNCLSNFSHIIRKDQVEAEKFLESFTSIYRYFLKHNQTDLVSLKEELNFLAHYLYLLEKRYGKAYSIENHICIEKGWIIPFAIQMCVENAIKHNQGFGNDPLNIAIGNNAKHVIIENDWRPLHREESTGYGLKNMMSHSKLITGEEVIAEQKSNKFIVKIPVITSVE